MKRLSVGDAIAVAVLLFFILAWLVVTAVYVLWRIDSDSLPSDPDKWSIAEGVWVSLLAYLPSWWAARLVTAVVDRDGEP